MTRLKKAHEVVGSENLFGILAMLSVLVAVARLAGVYWAVLLLGLLLFYLAWVVHGNASSTAKLERDQQQLIDTAVHEALHAAQRDQEALIGAVRSVVAQGIDEIRTETRRADLRPVV